jgi:hypothetical protein
MPDDDRPKKSWREIDSKRDRSQHRGPSEKRDDSPFGGGKKGEQRQKTYRSQLDRLFESGGIGKLVAEQEKQKQEELAQKMGMRPAPAAAPADKPAEPATPPADEGRIKKLATVRDAIGPDAITKAVSGYLKAYPWPNDLDFLSAALEHRDEDIIREALTRLASALAAGKPRRAATLAGRLRTLEELGADDEIRQKASELRRKL